MKKALLCILCFLTVCLVVFTYGFHITRNLPGDITASRVPEPVYSAETAEAVNAVSGLVDLKTATLEELSTLPGSGQAYAKRILEYRQETGPLHSVAQLPSV